MIDIIMQLTTLGHLSFVAKIDKVEYPITLEENQEDDSLLFMASFDSDPDHKITVLPFHSFILSFFILSSFLFILALLVLKAF